ncbi:MAG TPA: hypothetical protein VIT38_11435 [Allosphingosinicella sp.]
MNLLSLALAAALIAGGATAASAQTTAEAGPFPVTGNVPNLCAAGTLTGGGTAFDLGILSNESTGRMRRDLEATPKILTAAYCSTASTITIEATPLESVNNTNAPPPGFSRRIDYSATASGWTNVAAVYDTGSTSNPAATQSRATAFQGDITVSIGTFSTNGGDILRLVADPAYQGIVTVTLAATT